MNEVSFKEFPVEVFIPIEGQPQYLGRIQIHCDRKHYFAEIDIVFAGSRKIFQHIENLYQYPDPKDLLEQAVQKLAQFLSKEN